MTTKKAAPKAAPKKPAQTRAPRKSPPLDEKDILFCHMLMKGSADPKASQLARIEAAGAKLGYTKAEASKVYHRKPIQQYLETYRQHLMVQLVKEEVRLMRRNGYTREDVLGKLWELANMPVENGKMTDHICALAEMGKIMGLVVAPRNPDEFFKGRTEEEIAHFAEHGSFAPPRVN